MQNTVVPATFTARPGYQLVPALIGKPEASIFTPIECPTTWCTEDHVDEHVRNIEDVMHIGQAANLRVPSFAPGTATPISLHAEVQSDPVAADPRLRAAHIVIQDGGGSTYCHLDEDMTDSVADQLVAFASELRQKARTARLHNQALDGSVVRSQIDEALRRVRADAWRAYTQAELDAMSIRRLLKVFGVTVVEDGSCPAGKIATLTGDPGSMTLSCRTGATQAQREQTARHLLAAHVAVNR